MRRIRVLAVVLPLLCFVQPAHARSKHDWTKVEKLKPDTPVSIWLWSGDNIRGRVAGVTDAEVRLSRIDVSGTRLVNSRSVNRDDIQRIALIRTPTLPDPQPWMFAGALGGGVAGVITGSVLDGIHGDGGRWLVGGVVGTIFGFVGSCVVLAAIGTFRIAKIAFHSATIYEGTVPAQVPLQ